MGTQSILPAVVVSVVLMYAPAVRAQKVDKRPSLSTQASKLWKKTKQTVTGVGRDIGDAIGIGTRNDEDVVKVAGEYYMPVYATNLYDAEGAEEMRVRCRKLFAARFPNVTIVTASVPQTGWMTVPLMTGDKVSGYAQTLYCYVLGRDGTDGYLNARFSFCQQKKAGGVYGPKDGQWPAWERTDVLTNDIYQKLTEGNK